MAEYIEREALRNKLLSISIDTSNLYGCGVLEGLDRATKRLNEFPAADVAPVVHDLYIVSCDKLPPNPNGALTLSPKYIGKHESGWEIVADVHEDYYEWVNAFVAYKHDGWNSAFVAGDFESAVVSSSKKDYEEFLSLFPPDAWDYGDI